jgi:small subunit ribosomal protein S6
VDPESRPVLEDLKLAGDVEETRPGAPANAERAAASDEGGETEEEGTEEA